jgi:hypothetical protein
MGLRQETNVLLLWGCNTFVFNLHGACGDVVRTRKISTLMISMAIVSMRSD